MENIKNSEWILLVLLMLYIVMAPGTKVEESFNVQAIHDLLYHRLNISAYDHHEFPGVVPRTFIGPLALSFVLLPFIDICNHFNVSKLWVLFTVDTGIPGRDLCLEYCFQYGLNQLRLLLSGLEFLSGSG
ncbi:unnamed protein product [Enterobius vermicularis]|uniref:Mannosyltransferase n=1 Tax=Enterobius vermicularis TaxID=51028 RepID=A0A0N4VGG8_ENTVE|nr:unnamed protein product [Enterobius vermicularis]